MNEVIFRTAVPPRNFARRSSPPLALFAAASRPGPAGFSPCVHSHAPFRGRRQPRRSRRTSRWHAVHHLWEYSGPDTLPARTGPFLGAFRNPAQCSLPPLHRNSPQKRLARRTGRARLQSCPSFRAVRVRGPGNGRRRSSGVRLGRCNHRVPESTLSYGAACYRGAYHATLQALH